MIFAFISLFRSFQYKKFIITGAKCEKGAKCNRNHNTEIRDGPQESLDYVIGVGMGHNCNKGGSYIKG